jgi:hypothetical protein
VSKKVFSIFDNFARFYTLNRIKHENGSIFRFAYQPAFSRLHQRAARAINVALKLSRGSQKSSKGKQTLAFKFYGFGLVRLVY